MILLGSIALLNRLSFPGRHCCFALVCEYVLSSGRHTLCGGASDLQVLFKDSVSYLKHLQKGDIKSKSI